MSEYCGAEFGNRFERYVENVAASSDDTEKRLVAQTIIIDWLRQEKQKVEQQHLHDPWDLPWPTDANGDTITPWDKTR